MNIHYSTLYFVKNKREHDESKVTFQTISNTTSVDKLTKKHDHLRVNTFLIEQLNQRDYTVINSGERALRKRRAEESAQRTVSLLQTQYSATRIRWM